MSNINTSPQPSNLPSRQPTKQPTNAPTRAPSPFLFYPGWDYEYEGCLIDGNEPTYIASNPTAYMFTSLESCCTAHFNWMYDDCIGSTGGGGSATGLYYPDWGGQNIGCLNDGNEPDYMISNPTGYMFSTLDDCCSNHYYWMHDTCMASGGGTGTGTGSGTIATSAPSGLYYPDWLVDNTCKNDGNEPEYMSSNTAAWMHSTLESCCKKNFNWNLDVCMGSGGNTGTGATMPSSASGLYYPDWSTQESVCKNDGNEPEYMSSNTAGWMHSTLDSCCKMNYSWDYDLCMGSSGGSGGAGAATTTVGPSGLYYPDWLDGDTCKNDGNEPEYMSSNPLAWMHSTLESCCAKNYSWVFDVCMGSGGGGGGGGTAAPAGSNKWYADWDAKTCIQDTSGSLANSWDHLHNSKSTCCSNMMPWADSC